MPVAVAPAWHDARREQQHLVYILVNIAALHSIGGCFFCLIDIPFRMDDDRFGQGAQVSPHIIDPALIDQNVKASIRRHKLALSAPRDSRQ